MAHIWEMLIGLVLVVHTAFILWVVFGYTWGRRRRWLAVAHIASMAWAVAIEILPWPCPLTLLEQDLERHAGAAAYHGAFLVHYLGEVVYPGISDALLAVLAAAVLGINMAAYIRRARRDRARRHAPAMGQ